MNSRMLLAAAAIAALSSTASLAGAQGDTTLKTQRKIEKLQADSIKKAQRDSIKAAQLLQAKLGRYTKTIPESLASQAIIIETDAAQTALTRVHAGARIQSVELKDYNGKLAWSYELRVPETKGLQVIIVDAKNGDVIGRALVSAEEVKAREAEARAARKAARVKPAPKP